MHGSGTKTRMCRSGGGRGKTALTCSKGFGHQPGQIAGDFGPGEIIVVKGLDGWNNERLLQLPGVRSIPHLSRRRLLGVSALPPSHGVASPRRGGRGGALRPSGPGRGRPAAAAAGEDAQLSAPRACRLPREPPPPPPLAGIGMWRRRVRPSVRPRPPGHAPRERACERGRLPFVSVEAHGPGEGGGWQGPEF